MFFRANRPSASYYFSKHMEKNIGEKRQGSSFDGHYIILEYIIILPTQTIHDKMGHPSNMTSSNSPISRRHWTPRYSRCMSPSPSSLGPSLGSSLSSTWTGEEKTSENLISWNPWNSKQQLFERGWLSIGWFICLLGKWLFLQTSIQNWSFRVPGT